MQDRHLCWLPYFFLGPAVHPPTFFIIESPLYANSFSDGKKQNQSVHTHYTAFLIIFRVVHEKKDKKCLRNRLPTF